MKRQLTFFLLLGILVAACNPPPPASQPVTLKIAVIPVIDTLPMFVAQTENLFEKNNVKVELVPVASAAERDQLVQAGRVDGTLNETLAVMFFNKDKVQLQAVRYGLMANKDTGHFYILGSNKSGISNVSGLKGVEIGVSQGTIIDYVTTRLLESNGFADNDIKTIAVPKISDRMSLLASGELNAAVMPDPLAALAVQQGAKILLTDQSQPQLGASIISFRKEIIDAHPDAIKAFLKAIETAVEMINADQGKFSSLLTDNKIVPQSLIGKYMIPKFPLKGVPSEEDWNDVIYWAISKKLLNSTISYSESVNSKFLP
jgi:NitT/TauT family transport system substrate-binding protein